MATITETNISKVDDWLERLAQETDVARASALFQGYLKALASFWHYSPSNCVLIMQQRPDAMQVNSRKRWEKLGYRVRKGEYTNPIQILCPHFRWVEDKETKEKREVLDFFTTGFIFSRDQIEPGDNPQPLDVPWQQVAGDYSSLYDLLVATCTRLHIQVSLSDQLPPKVEGLSDGQGHIKINSRADVGNRAATLVHETAHELIHPGPLRAMFTRQEVEVQAESVAFCVGTALGLPMPNSGIYLVLHGSTKEVLKLNAQAIHTGVRRILTAIEATATHEPLPVAPIELRGEEAGTKRGDIPWKSP